MPGYRDYDVDDDESGMRDFLWLLWVRRGSVLAVLAVVVGGMLLAFAGQPKIYQSTAEVLVRPLAQRPGSVDLYEVVANMEPARRVATSRGVRRLVEQRLGYPLGDDPSDLTVEAPDGSNTLFFRASSTSPTVAHQMAEAHVEVYLEVRLQELLDDLADALKPIEQRLAVVTGEIDSSQDALLYAVEPERSSLEAKYASLIGERRTLEEQRNGLNAPELRQVGRVLQPAALPKSPVGPYPKKTLAVAMLLGGALGVGQAVGRSRITPRVQGSRDLLEEAGAPVLAMVRKLPRPRKGGVTLVEPQGKGADGYHTLAATVLSAMNRGALRSLLITSPGAGEDRTTVTANLAAFLAAAGKRVEVLSTGGDWWDLESRFGGEDDVDGASAPASPGPRPLVVRAKGGVPGRPSPGSSISADDVRSALSEREADLVLVDAPPVVGRFETLAIAPLVDAVVIVAAADRTTRVRLRVARSRLDQTGARVLGAVLAEVPGARIWFEYRFETRPSFAGNPFFLPGGNWSVTAPGEPAGSPSQG